MAAGNAASNSPAGSLAGAREGGGGGGIDLVAGPACSAEESGPAISGSLVDGGSGVGVHLSAQVCKGFFFDSELRLTRNYSGKERVISSPLIQAGRELFGEARHSGTIPIGTFIYTDLVNAVSDCIHKMMVESYGMIPMGTVFVSPNAKTTETLVVLICGLGVVAGQWSSGLCLTDSLRTGSVLPFLEWARKVNMGIIVLNPNKKFGEEKHLTSTEIVENNLLSSWKFVKENFPEKMVAVVAHAYGATCVYELIARAARLDTRRRLQCIAFCDANVPNRVLPLELQIFFQDSCVNWISSNKPRGTYISTSFPVMPHLSSGTARQDAVVMSAFDPICDFLVRSTCRSLLRELKHILDEIGEDDTEHDVQLEEENLELYRRKVDQASHVRAKLRQALADSEAELAALQSALGEHPTFTRKASGTLREQVKGVASQLEELQAKKDERIKLFNEISSQIRKIYGEIVGSATANEVFAKYEDLSQRRLEEYQDQLHALQNERSNRLHKVLEYVNSVHDLCADLGLDFFKIITEAHPRSITNETLDRLANTIRALEEEKKRRIKKHHELGTKLVQLLTHLTCNVASSECVPGSLAFEIIEEAEVFRSMWSFLQTRTTSGPRPKPARKRAGWVTTTTRIQTVLISSVPSQLESPLGRSLLLWSL